MEFTYEAYGQLLEQIVKCEYQFANYHNWKQFERCVILRHDIDYDPIKAVKIAEIEKDKGISSTYFVLITSDFYNIYSEKNNTYFQTLMSYGHEIGLHFDETRYEDLRHNVDMLKSKILYEAKRLEDAIQCPVTTVSMHRPSKLILKENLKIPGLINSYGKEFLYDFKYLSDSRKIWREPIKDLIESREYDRFHILTHAFWYSEFREDIRSSVSKFINRAAIDRWNVMQDNITNLADIVSKAEFG